MTQSDRNQISLARVFQSVQMSEGAASTLLQWMAFQIGHDTEAGTALRDAGIAVGSGGMLPETYAHRETDEDREYREHGRNPRTLELTDEERERERKDPRSASELQREQEDKERQEKNPSRQGSSDSAPTSNVRTSTSSVSKSST